MDTTIQSLSSLDSPLLSSNMGRIDFKQFKRSYPGGYSFNFARCFEEHTDFLVKNYSNFYLTARNQFDELFDTDAPKLKASSISTSIQYGSEYLQFRTVDPKPFALQGDYRDSLNYGACVFTSSVEQGTLFTIEILENNQCRIYHTKNTKRYYLCCDSSNKVIFANRNKLSFDEEINNPQDFDYIFSEDENYIFLFKARQDGSYYLRKQGNSLGIVKVTESNVLQSIANPFRIGRSIYTTPITSFNTSFITYGDNNKVDKSKSLFDLNNNFLLHKTYSENTSKTNIIVLKNQLLQNNVFSSANNLLSSSGGSLYVDNLRDYTSISEDITGENSDNISLNYVLYNKPYHITPGSNRFTTPDSMYPFTRLNINDTKFVDSGAFSNLSPEYSDKIYHLAEKCDQGENGQYLLCTWLSGSVASNQKVWMDRYYYPDFIEKSEAMSASPLFAPTYDNIIENIINNNTNLQDRIKKTKFFDRKSDLVFEPNQTYDYTRIDLGNFGRVLDILEGGNLKEDNHHTLINNKGMITLGVYFEGNDSDWTILSDRNSIDSGITVSKKESNLSVKFSIYDPSTGKFDTVSTQQSIKPLEENFFALSIDTYSGNGYFFLNNIIVRTFRLSFAQYYKKMLLYGDFYINSESKKLNLSEYSDTGIVDIVLLNEFIQPSEMFVVPIKKGKTAIDDLYITLPSGMINSIDEIEYLHSICGSSAFKSNNININVKNLGINNENIKKGITDTISTAINDILPVTMNIEDVDFENFK